MGAYAQEKAQRYSWSAVASQVAEVYEEARETATAAAHDRYEVTSVHNTV